MITDDSYQKKIDELYPFLLMASPDQLQNISQQVQPNSPEAMALAMATAYQQQAKQQTQAPQETVLQKNLAALQQPQQPQQPQQDQQGQPQAGIPSAGANQMALQQAAAQDPNMAGIAAAPENVPGAATGGLVAFAHGGDVRRFNGRDGSLANLYGDDSRYSNLYSDAEAYDIPSSLRSSEYGPRSSVGMYGDSLLNAPNEGTTLEDIKDQIARDNAQREAGTPFRDVEIAKRLAGLGRLASEDVATPLTDKASDLTKALLEATTTDSAQAFTPTPKARPIKEATEGVKAKSPIDQHIETRQIAHASTGANTDRISGSATTQMRNAFGLKDVAEPEGGFTPESEIAALKGLRGEGFKMSPELMQKYEEASKEANRDKWLEAMASGIGGMLSAPTEHWQRALGTGLIDATAAYQHGAKNEEEAGLRYLAAQLGQEQAPYEAQQGAYKDWMDMQKAKMAAQAQRDVAGLRGGNAYALEAFKERNRLLHPEVHGSGGMDTKDYSQILANIEATVKGRMDKLGLSPDIDAEEYTKKQDEIRSALMQQLGLPQSGAQTANPLSSLGKVFLRQ